jgi:pimeloyl-ACP methyl ester carboxylesterase
MRSIETSTGPISYDERGQGHPIVLLASGAHDHHDYDELRALLPTSYRSLALDWPGHGQSPSGEGPASAMRFADVTEEVVEQLAPGGAVIVGNSVGGFSATRLAIRRPELVRGLVIVDGGGFAGRPLQVRAFCALMSHPWFLKRIYPSFAARYMRAQTDADRRALAVGIATTRADPGLRAVAELWSSFSSPEHDLRTRVSEITAPTLLIWGRRDPVIPLRIGVKMAAAIPGARIEVLDTGHVPHTSNPERFAGHLIPFAEAAFETLPADHGKAA